MALALIYVRRSMVRYEEDRASPERQLANCVAVCEEKGWSYEVYEDAEGHRSGRSERHRPGWHQLKAQLGRGDVVAVVVNSLDRASRSPRDFFVFLDSLQKYNVELVSVHEQFDTTNAIGKAFLAILMVVASLESDLASERVMDSVRHRRERGVHVGIAPFGYDREGGLLVRNGDAGVVELMAEMYATGEYSYVEVAADLNRRGYRFRDRYGGKRFSEVSVRSVLQNASLYAGRLPVGRERGYAYGQLYDGGHEAVIGAGLAEQVLAARRSRRRQGGGVARVYLLTGVGYCYECGGRLWGMGRGRRGRYFYRHAEGSCRRRKGSWDAVDVEAQVVGLLDGLSLPGEIEGMVRERVRQRARAEPGNAELVEALERERQKLMRLRELRIEGEIGREEYHSRKAELAAVTSSMEGRLGAAGYDAQAALQRLADVGEVVRAGDPAQQRRVVRSVFERVELSVVGGGVARVVPRPWFRVLFRDLAEVWCVERAWRGPGAESVPRLRAVIG